MTHRAFLLGCNSLGLKFSEKDAEILGMALEKYGYKLTFPALEKTSIIHELDQFIDNSNAMDTLIFYFSGHGHFVRNKLFLLLGNEPTRSSNLLSAEIILSTITSARGENKLIILDCCNAGVGSTEWKPEISERYMLLTATGMFEKTKEIDDYGASFLTYSICRSLTTHRMEVEKNNHVLLSNLYSWLCQEARSFNERNNIQVAIPNLYGNQKTDFTIVISKENERDLGIGGATIAAVDRMPVGRHLRERCRVFAGGSPEFNELITRLFCMSHSEKQVEEYRVAISKLSSEYERTLTLAALHEKLGKNEQIPSILERLSEKDDKHNTCMLFTAIALEKQDETNPASEILLEILRKSQNMDILLAAQFNLDVCCEKMKKYDKVEFPRFFGIRKALVGTERVCDKALTMHLVVCQKTGIEFVYQDRLEDTLAYESDNSPIAYVKTIMNYLQVEGKCLNRKEFHRIYNMTYNMNINIRVAVLAKLLKQLDEYKHSDLCDRIVNDIEKLCEGTKSKVMRKHLESAITFRRN